LVKEWGGTGSIRLRRFWAGRARRLLPALFLLVAVIGIVLAVVPRLLQTPHVLGDAMSTIFYVSNWYSIHGGVGYFSLSTAPSPLLHTWSLAIEEQFYLIWPLVVLGVLRLGTGRRMLRRRAGRHGAGGRGAVGSGGAGGARGARGASGVVPVLGGGSLVMVNTRPQSHDPEWTRRRRLHILFAVACLGSLVSALVMVLMAPDGYTTRAYYGTDTRAQALLVGAAVAIGLTLWKEASQRRWFVRTAGVLGLAGIAGTAALWMTTAESTTFAFSGGFLMASFAAGAVVLGCAVAPRSLVVRLLELPPLPQWGRISYGVYLWYWPVLLVMTGQRLHWGVYPLFLARVGITVAIAALSYDLVEMPIRRGALRHWRSWVAAPIGAAAAISAIFVSTLVPVGATELQGSQINLSASQVSVPGVRAPSSTTTTTVAAAADPPAGDPTSTTAPPTTTTTRPDPYLQPAVAGAAAGGAPAAAGAQARPVKVLLVGDSIAGSLGVGLAQYGDTHNVQIVNEGTPGCSLAMLGQIRVLFYSLAPGAPCDVHNHPASLLDTWRNWVDAYNPDVVLYVARGETFDQQVGGTWQNVSQAGFARRVESRFQQAVDVLGSKGAAVVLMSSPYYSSGTSPSGTSWPEDAPGRVQADDAIMRAVAHSAVPGPAGGKVYVYDLNSLVSPGRHYAASVAGVNVRCTDGVHFSRSGGILVGLRLVPDLAALGQAHASSSPGGAWPGRLPASTPQWFQKLPCQ
jgi:peptidoglycan/LPS O-acetylase OafA/YrhL